MDFNVGDRVRLTGIGWSESSEITTRPRRGDVVTVEGVDRIRLSQEKSPFFRHPGTGKKWYIGANGWDGELEEASLPEQVRVSTIPPAPPVTVESIVKDIRVLVGRMQALGFTQTQAWAFVLETIETHTPEETP